MSAIAVSEISDGTYEVRVSEGGGETSHRVTVDPDTVASLGLPDVERVALVEESFRFLLEREPKEAILSSFELSVIERYFPEYPDEIRRRLGTTP